MNFLIYILFFEMLALCLCILLTKGDLLSPEFGFIACFIPGTMYAFFWAKRWLLNPSPMTVLVYAGGLATFLLVSILLKRKKTPAMLQTREDIRFDMIHVQPWKLVVIGIFQFIIFGETIRYLTGRFGVDLSSAIYTFRSTSIAKTEALPTILRMFHRLSLASGYITGYLFVLGLVTQEKKGRFLYLGNAVLSLINGVILGARGDSVQMIFSFIMDYFLLYRMIRGGKRINTRKLLKAAGLVLLMGLLFAQIGELLGRGMSRFRISEYIAIYMSAEIKNLDTFVRQGEFGSDILHSSVFHEVLSHFTSEVRTAGGGSGFQFVNGYELGNVSTVFQPFLHDMGYFGVIFYTAIMALISQVSYRFATKPKSKKTIYFSVIVYSHMWSCLVLSFFSDKFFEYLTSSTFLWMILSWFALRWILCDVRITFGKKQSLRVGSTK